MSFQTTVLAVAVIVLMVCLVFVGVSLNNTYKVNWPPMVGACPDYWVDELGNGEKCTNPHKLGKCKLEKGSFMNFNQSPFTDASNGTCNKYKWASACQVTWDGINSGVPNPCSS